MRTLAVPVELLESLIESAYELQCERKAEGWEDEPRRNRSGEYADLVATVEAARALLAAQGGVEGPWMPLESAPTDGTKVDVWGKDCAESFNGKPARRYTGCRFIHPTRDWKAGYWWNQSHGKINATHWMPEPEAPAPEER